MSKPYISMKNQYRLITKYTGENNNIVGGELVVVDKPGIVLDVDRETLVAMAKIDLIVNVYYLPVGKNGTFRTLDDNKIPQVRVTKLSDVSIEQALNLKQITKKKVHYELTVDNVEELVKRYNFKVGNVELARDKFNCSKAELKKFREDNMITDSDIKNGINQMKELVEEGKEEEVKEQESPVSEDKNISMLKELIETSKTMTTIMENLLKELQKN